MLSGFFYTTLVQLKAPFVKSLCQTLQAWFQYHTGPIKSTDMCLQARLIEFQYHTGPIKSQAP
jgi:hypothetical protein